MGDDVRGELVDFLLARLAEDRERARAATPGPWSVDSDVYAEAIYGPDGATPVAGGRWGGEASVFDSTDDALHIARHDPARVLAECEAKRQIVEEFNRIGSMSTSDALDGGTAAMAILDGLEMAIRYLALPYADHRDYRQEWKP